MEASAFFGASSPSTSGMADGGAALPPSAVGGINGGGGGGTLAEVVWETVFENQLRAGTYTLPLSSST